ncbi:hypothetical protein [Pseudoxanthomonas winnipegensis]|uniref:hypothetical protein n=1 Tax=Pseudoxanthomonas winnipegensis TaxID=2480810 RepID=UPI00102DABF3|nr:hypothetical protein [Pseudoxanthomonas winnipegensis]RZZ85685.1 hypothetical protein EA663_11800 [Pseudoxanthomonas winnipegensis]
MSAPKWQPSTSYAPNTIVQRATALPVTPTQVVNGDFSSGTTGWSFGSGAALSGGGYGGGNCASFNGTGGAVEVVHDAVDCGAGVGINARCMYQQGTAGSGHNVGRVFLRFLGAGGSVVSTVRGNDVSSSGGGWKASTVSTSSPVGTLKVQIGVEVVRDRTGASFADSFTWSLTTAATVVGLVFKATQASAATSGTTEPMWPTTAGGTVTDGGVTWTAILGTRVEWTARPLLVSGASEPAFTAADGTLTPDNTIAWLADTREIKDSKCPHSKVVAIMSSHVFAADGDIVRFSASTNPLDWTSESNAGYLSTGLQQDNANDMLVLNQYRSNLVALNASVFQHWQMDPDPTAMALLDQLPGIGSVWQKAAAPVGTELFILTAQGVRSIGASAATQSLTTGDVGMPVDPLVREALRTALSTGKQPVGTYVPGAGQYWLAFPDHPAVGRSTVFVYSMVAATKVRAWSIYEYPFAVEAFAQLGNDLYIRHGDEISVVSEGVTSDTVGGQAIDFPGQVQFQWLDMGGPGGGKMMEGFDIVATGSPRVSIGYDQRDAGAFTPPYAVPADTMPGGITPLAVTAPSMSVRVDFDAGEAWSLQEVSLYLFDNGGGP